MNEAKSRRIISAGLIVYRITEEGIKFLLLYRGRSTWDMPRGRMESGERSVRTAFREVYEETGLSSGDLAIDHSFRRVYEKFPYTRDNEKFFKIIIFYLAKTSQAQIRLSDEHEGYGWFTLKEAQKHLSKFRKRKDLLRKAWEHISVKQQNIARPKPLDK